MFNSIKMNYFAWLIFLLVFPSILEAGRIKYHEIPIYDAIKGIARTGRARELDSEITDSTKVETFRVSEEIEKSDENEPTQPEAKTENGDILKQVDVDLEQDEEKVETLSHGLNPYKLIQIQHPGHYPVYLHPVVSFPNPDANSALFRTADPKKTATKSDTGKLVLALGTGYLLYNAYKNQQQQQQQQQYQQYQQYYNNYPPSYSPGPAYYPSYPTYNSQYSGAGSFYGKHNEPILVHVPTITRFKRSTDQEEEEPIKDTPKGIRITVHPMEDEALYRMGAEVLAREDDEKKGPSKGAYLVGGLAALALAHHAFNNNRPRPPPQYQYAPPPPQYLPQASPVYHQPVQTTYYPSPSSFSPTTTTTYYPSYPSTSSYSSYPGTSSYPGIASSYPGTASSYPGFGRIQEEDEENKKLLTFQYLPVQTEDGTILPIVF